MYDSVDVTLTNPIIADSLRPPEVARTLVVAGITLTQQCLHVKIVQDLWLSTLRGCSTTNKTRISVEYIQDRHCTASPRSQRYGSNIVCKLSWRNRSKPSLHISFPYKSTDLMSSFITAILRHTRGSTISKTCMLHKLTACPS